MTKFQKSRKEYRQRRYEWQLMVHAIIIVVILFIMMYYM